MIQPSFLMFFDDTPRKDVAIKLSEAAAAYQQRFGHVPAVAVVNEADAGTTLAGLRIITRPGINKNNYWLGQNDPN